MWMPSGQTVGVPAAHSEMSQSCVPVTPAFGHSTRHVAPSLHTLWHGPLAHLKSHFESGPQVHVPFEQVPLQSSFLRQSTWQGGAAHSKSQVAFWLQVHWPLAHTPVHSEASPQFTWHGGASQVKSQLDPAGQTHSPFTHSVSPHEGVKTTPAIAKRNAATEPAATGLMRGNISPRMSFRRGFTCGAGRSR